MQDMLLEMFELQRQLLVEKMGGDPGKLEDSEKITFILTMAYALEDEIHEATQEVGWKPWATSQHINREAYKGELIDVWHFLMNLFLVAEITPFELYEDYKIKRNKNAQRQDEGYDGVSTKCPGCKRALDDDAVNCLAYLTTDGQSIDRVYCVVQKRVLFFELPGHTRVVVDSPQA